MSSRILPVLALSVLWQAAGAGPGAAQQAGGSSGNMEAAELSAVMVREISSLLDQLLGPGKAKAYVHMEGSSTEENKQSEVLTPKSENSDQALIPPPPGYPYPFQYLSREQQQSKRLTGFRIQKLHVSILIDNSISQERVSAIRKVIEDMLRLEPSRGDSLMIIRAELFPAWKTLLSSPGVLQTIVGQLALIIGLFLVCAIAYLLGMRVVRRLGDALAMRRPPTEVLPVGASPMGPGLPGPLGGPPSISELEGGEQGPLSLGYQPHFSYLSSKPPKEIARILEEEPPADVAIALTWLADRSPELGIKLFSALTDNFRLEVSRIMAGLKLADPEKITLLDSKLRTQVEFSLRGTEKLGRLLSPLPQGQRDKLMQELARLESDTAREVADSMLTFEDILQFPKPALRRIVGTFQLDVWAAALHDAEPKLAGCIAEQIPVELRTGFLDSLRAPQSSEKVMDARSKIMMAAIQMKADGALNAAQA